MSSAYELSDIPKFSSETALAPSNDKKSSGCHVTVVSGFILALLAIAIAVGVGIIVHFAGPARDFECTCTCPSGGDAPSAEAIRQECLKFAQDGDQEICTACSGAGCPTTTAPPSTSAAPSTTTAAPSTTAAATTTATTASTTPPPPINVRLPGDLEPVLYTLELQPNMYEGEPADFTFNGSVKIDVHCKMATNEIKLHINKLNITSAITVMATGNSADLYSVHSFDLERQFIVIETTSTLMPGMNYSVEMSFVGPLAADLAGLYLSSYSRDGQTIHIATTQMQPTDARKTFPCFDEPAIKAEFDVTLFRKSHMISLSNMPIADSTSRGNDWFADKFVRTAKMSTYLLAFIVCDFNYTMDVTTNNITYRAYSRPEAIDQTPYSLQVGVDILTFFEDYFNVPYPLPKQDMIAIPDFAAGAMENWGLITYRETAMLYEPGVSSEGNKQRVAVVVSHELAHQWFGNLVTPSWWDDLWLNEGFASYVEYMGVDFVHPDWKMFDQIVVADVQNVMSFDGLISSHPVYVPVSHPDEINEIFDLISYAKGASIIRMMRFFLGDDTFRNGLTNYLTDLAYGAAFHDDLWFALGNQSIADGNTITDVKGIMDTWTLQMNYPTVHVMHNSANQITVSQSRYLQDPNATDPGKYESPFGYRWEIPFTFTTSTALDFNVTEADIHMMHKTAGSETIADVSIPGPGGDNWVLGNVNEFGYYRVNYNQGNWDALISQLKRDHTAIISTNRAQIINDAWSLARSGDLNMDTALRTTEYLSREREYVPWSAASGELGFVGTMLQREDLYGSFARFMQNITTDAFNEIGMNNTGATHLESYVRSNIVGLACGYGIQGCIDEAQRLFSDWMNNPDNNPIDPGLKSTVYCQAVAQGGEREWQFAFDQYSQANLAAEQSRLLSAMACSRTIWILSRYLNMALAGTEIRRQDSVGVINAIAGNPVGRSLAWDFFRANWDFLLNDFGAGSFSFSSLIRGVTGSFNTPFDLEQLESFIASQPDLGSGARAFDQAVERTRSNIQWMDANMAVIQQWLSNQGF